MDPVEQAEEFIGRVEKYMHADARKQVAANIAARPPGVANEAGPLDRLGEVGLRAYTAICRDGRESQSVFSSQYPGSSF